MSMTEWFRTFDESFWLRPDDVGAEEAAFIRKALRLRKGQRVLDAPCGAGRIAVHLAKAGCIVTGVDLTESFIRRARGRFRRERLPGTFTAMDLRQLDFHEQFHGIYNWLGSFGYFSDAENADLVCRYARALRPGGRLLIDQPNREFLLRHFARRKAFGDATSYNRWDARAERVESRRIARRQGRSIESLSSIRLYTPSQMRRLCERAGLT
ncbi:MAG: methyltransferase domain-containing protein, partial [Planctomycetes bacterium]|nr:methyltransferase domain-containing protein [Planctomycetota bacterium]